MPIVVDASATLAWLFGEIEPGDWLDEHLQSNLLIAPSLWQLEVVHAVLKKERQHSITPQQSDAFFKILDAISIEIVPPAQQTVQNLAIIARPHQLSVYDATCLDLAIQRNADLLTLDNNLRDAARRMNISLI